MRSAILFVLISISTFAQTSSAPAPLRNDAAPPLPADLAQVVRQQFGPGFTLAMKRSNSTVAYLHPPAEESWTPFLTMDINNDGVEDAIVVARAKNALTGQGKFNYKVVDPYFTYHGYGDPKITATLSSEDPDQGHIVLIIHGAGTEGWRAAVPKAKFAVVNLPFENLSSTMTEDGKRNALNLESREASVGAIIYWDGKRYKWKEQ